MRGFNPFSLFCYNTKLSSKIFPIFAEKWNKGTKNSVVQEMPKGACTSACVSSLINLTLRFIPTLFSIYSFSNCLYTSLIFFHTILQLNSPIIDDSLLNIFSSNNLQYYQHPVILQNIS